MHEAQLACATPPSFTPTAHTTQSELKFQAPPEARVCRKPAWLLYVFKGSETVGEPLPLTQLPYYLFGKDRKVADIPTDHPSCSRQHAVVVFR
jgi:smad nuclear-interacting protein 1